MGRKNRCDVIDESEVGVYHVMSACGRQRFLFGEDSLSGRDFSHRRGWIVDLLEHLLTSFAIDASAFAVLMNHFHLILRNRPDVAESWSEEEVAVRWWRRTAKHAGDLDARPKDSELRRMVSDAERIATLRQRLASPSWFMKELKQPIARWANKEDKVLGHFFEGRFKAFRLHEELDVVAANLYVDLNEIRAGIATSLEGAEYSSAYRRLARLKKAESCLLAGDPEQAEYYAPSDPDFWLAPINEQGEAPPLFSLAADASAEDSEQVAESELEHEFTSNNPGADESESKRKRLNADKKRQRERVRRGLLPMSLKDYIRLLDEVGRMAAPGKRGVIDPTLPPALEQISARSPLSFDERIQSLFTRFAALHSGYPEQPERSQESTEEAPPESVPFAGPSDRSVAPRPDDAPTGGRDPTDSG